MAAWSIWQAAALRLRYPPVWPDEALFAEPARELLRHGTFGTPSLAGTLPGIEHHTWWMPPLHPLLLAAVFGLFGFGVGCARAVSGLLAVIAVVLAARLPARLGLPSRWGAVPVVMLVSDTVFLRAGLLARMDMLCLALVLAALLVGLPGPAKPDHARAGWACGLLGGLALLAHPAALPPVAVFLLARAVAWPQAAKRFLPRALVGLVLVTGPWLASAAVHRESAVGQLAAQMARKAHSRPSGWELVGNLTAGLAEYDADAAMWRLGSELSVAWRGAAAAMGVVYCLGLLGLVLPGPGRRARGVLAAVALAQIGFAASAVEMWYAVYPLPLAVVGCAALLGRWPPRRRVLPALLMAVAVGSNLLTLTRLRLELVDRDPCRVDYQTWCAELSARLPSGATVMLCCLPDPWFGLAGREDLTLREFVPEYAATPEVQEAVLATCDYAVACLPAPSTVVQRYVTSHGRAVGPVGRTDGYWAVVFELPHARAK